MYLYDKSMGNLNVYEVKIDKENLIEYKKKYLEEIKSVVLHVQEKGVEDLLFWSNVINFSELDKKTDKEFNYIELINNNTTINRYINGLYDEYSPISIVCDDFNELGFYTDLRNDDYTLLFKGGVNTGKEFISYESVLLSGNLQYHQQLIHGDINKLNYIDSYLIDEEFIRLIRCGLVKSFNYNDLKSAKEYGIYTLDENLDKNIEKSYSLLKLINK